MFKDHKKDLVMWEHMCAHAHNWMKNSRYEYRIKKEMQLIKKSQTEIKLKM